MDNIPAYIRRKHGQEPVTYLHPLLEPYLEKTYGIFVYQEDIMAAAMALGGFTGPEADTLGYAIRKKKSSVLRAQKEKFVSQAAERGVEPGVIDAVFKAFEPFERYGFNKAHATCYGLIAYQTAYLKANHTVDYMTAVLTAFRANEEKVAAAVAECRRMGIEVRPPDVHASHLEFTVEGDAIRFGLLAVKNVGQGAIESIIAARDEGGEFRSLTDFCTRIDLRLATARSSRRSSRSARSTRSATRPSSCWVSTTRSPPAQATQRDRITGQTSLFDMGAATRSPSSGRCRRATEVPVRERLRWEKELLGLYLSEHPMGEVAEQVGRFVNAYSGDLRDESLDGQRVVVGGIVTGAADGHHEAPGDDGDRHPRGPPGLDRGRRLPAACTRRRGRCWRDGAILLIAGRVDHKGEEVSLLADLVADWDDAATRGPEAFAREVAAGDRGGETVVPADGGGRAGPGRRGRRRWRGAGAAAGPVGRRRAGVRVARPDGRRRSGAARRDAADRARRARPDVPRGAGAIAGWDEDDARRRAAGPGRGAGADRRRATQPIPVAAGPERGPARPVRGRAGAGPAGRGDGDRQSCCYATDRAARRSSSTSRPPGGGEALPDGAALGRGLRRGAAGRGPPPARRGPGRDAARAPGLASAAPSATSPARPRRRRRGVDGSMTTADHGQ